MCYSLSQAIAHKVYDKAHVMLSQDDNKRRWLRLDHTVALTSSKSYEMKVLVSVCALWQRAYEETLEALTYADNRYVVRNCKCHVLL